MVEHHGRRQAFQQRGILDDLVGAHVDLEMPAEARDALRQRVDHVDRDRGGARIEHRETDAADAAVRHRLQLGVGDGRMHHRDAARVGLAELLDAVERDAVVGHIRGGRDDDGARRAVARLQQAILRHRRVALHARLRPRPRGREAVAVIDVHVAVAGIGRSLQLRRLGAFGIRNSLRVCGCRAGRNQCRTPRQKCPAFNHVSPPRAALMSRAARPQLYSKTRPARMPARWAA